MNKQNNHYIVKLELTNNIIFSICSAIVIKLFSIGFLACATKSKAQAICPKVQSSLLLIEKKSVTIITQQYDVIMIIFYHIKFLTFIIIIIKSKINKNRKETISLITINSKSINSKVLVV